MIRPLAMMEDLPNGVWEPETMEAAHANRRSRFRWNCARDSTLVSNNIIPLPIT